MTNSYSLTNEEYNDLLQSIRYSASMPSIEDVSQLVQRLSAFNSCSLHPIYQPLGKNGCGGCQAEIAHLRSRACCRHDWGRIPCPGHEPPDCTCTCHD